MQDETRFSVIKSNEQSIKVIDNGCLPGFSISFKTDYPQGGDYSIGKIIINKTKIGEGAVCFEEDKENYILSFRGDFEISTLIKFIQETAKIFHE